MKTALSVPSNVRNLRRKTANFWNIAAPLALLSFVPGCAEPAGLLCDETSPEQQAPMRRGSLSLTADPNGLFWQDSSQTLYITDDTGNQIVAWSDRGGLRPAAKLPPPPATGPGLGQVVLTGRAQLVVPRFGMGTAGDVLAGPADGELTPISGLLPERRRIGLTQAADGTLYGTYFVKAGTGRAGAVTTLTLTGGETDVITGLQKPVGVLAVADRLYVSDQDAGKILQAPLANPSATSVFATLPAPDLLAAGPDGSLFTGGPQGAVRQIAATGQATTVAMSARAVRGLAYDATARRLFVALHDSEPQDGITHGIEIVPIGSDPAACLPSP